MGSQESDTTERLNHTARPQSHKNLLSLGQTYKLPCLPLFHFEDPHINCSAQVDEYPPVQGVKLHVGFSSLDCKNETCILIL